MKRSYPPGEPCRFHGSLRHYHRSGLKKDAAWDVWIDGKAKPASRRNWFKILAIATAVLALAGIAVGLVIELGLL